MSAADLTWAMTLSLRSRRDMVINQKPETRNQKPLLAQYGDRCSVAALVFFASTPRRDGKMLAQVLAKRFSQCDRPEAVIDSYRLFAFEQRAVEELVRGFDRVVDVLSDQVELRANRGLEIRGSRNARTLLVSGFW